MEIGVYHEFHCRPDETPAEAFEGALAQVEAADRWGLVRPAVEFMVDADFHCSFSITHTAARR